MSNDNLDRQVIGPAITLAAKVKAALEPVPSVDTDWGNFYVGLIELVCYTAGEREVVGYLVPDEGAGDAFDFYTPKDFQP